MAVTKETVHYFVVVFYTDGQKKCYMQNFQKITQKEIKLVTVVKVFMHIYNKQKSINLNNPNALLKVHGKLMQLGFFFFVLFDSLHPINNLSDI